MDLVRSSTSHPSHSLQIRELCPKWTGNILVSPVCAEDVIAGVCEEESDGHNGRAWFRIHVNL